MNDENIRQLCYKLDELKKYFGISPFIINSTWVRDKYDVVKAHREQGEPSLRDEYNTMKLFSAELFRLLSIMIQIYHPSRLTRFITMINIVEKINDDNNTALSIEKSFLEKYLLEKPRRKNQKSEKFSKVFHSEVFKIRDKFYL